MDDKFRYRLSGNQKIEIAQNLIDIMEKGSGITERTITFIDNWIRTGPAEKGKAFFRCVGHRLEKLSAGNQTCSIPHVRRNR